jgi:hypothetical protein
MKTAILLTACLALAGCPSLGYQTMTPEQIKATAGTASCTQLTSIYGKGSAIAVNVDETRKGATSKGKTAITCGDATMTIETEVGAAPK